MASKVVIVFALIAVLAVLSEASILNAPRNLMTNNLMSNIMQKKPCVCMHKCDGVIDSE